MKTRYKIVALATLAAMALVLLNPPYMTTGSWYNTGESRGSGGSGQTTAIDGSVLAGRLAIVLVAGGMAALAVSFDWRNWRKWLKRAH